MCVSSGPEYVMDASSTICYATNSKYSTFYLQVLVNYRGAALFKVGESLFYLHAENSLENGRFSNITDEKNKLCLANHSKHIRLLLQVRC